MRIRDKIDRDLNDSYSVEITSYINERFKGIKFETFFNILDMRLNTTWKCDDQDKNMEIRAAIESYEAGYCKARSIARG